ncbi:MAG TPA: nucleotide exchange factor GrpE [Bacillota bacterium]|nr:nucleotide exchange factor GrpE [Bacillota bacterium]HOC06050.1 nucleotide exchange factor GrpE [Bacillota bacterium]HPZ21551.1 nucleotide exchange factor GrpE [Bacillota bacterium]HQD19582.1 nucleotide exchange factor GrpE [Bacillota bacterium]
MTAKKDLAPKECAECVEQSVNDENNLELEKVKTELETLQANYIRLAADFDNYRKRTQRQTQEVVARANEELFCQLLPVLDNFSIALESLTDESVLKGMTMIYDQLMGVLEAEGVKVIEATGCTFDPMVHEAVGFDHCPDLPENAIIEELRKGYTLGGKVIRPAAVKVNIKKEDAD